MGYELGALGGCVEGASIECVYGRQPGGPVEYESWSVFVQPNAERDPWWIPVPDYAGGAATVAGLLARGGLPAEGPFEVSYYELGSGKPYSKVAPAGMEFRSHGGAQLDFTA